VNFGGKFDCGTPFSTCFKFGANACNNGRVMAKIVIFNMASCKISCLYVNIWVSY